jgi:hypothetical protein
MICKTTTILIFLCLCVSVGFVKAQVADTSWKRTQTVVDSCFTFHGRLQLANGTPSVRIWIVGTKRYLAVHEIETQGSLALAMPAQLMQFVGPDTLIYGDFRVCPITRHRLGQMQVVCIESASGLVIERFYEDNKGTRTRTLTRIDDID